MSRVNRISGKFAYGGVLIVPIEIDGVILRFMVDTGAAYCSVNRRALDKIVAEPTTEKRWVAPVGKQLIEATTLRIENFLVGGLREKGLKVSVVDFPEGFQIDGLLGMDFMGKYRITIEPDTKTLVLREIPKKK